MNTKLCINAFAAGDFTLFHNNTLYKYYIGGYLESCLNKQLDCEFAMRQKWINNLTLYNIDYNCSYWHIDHIHQRENRNNYTRFTQTKININCNQIGDNSLSKFRTNYEDNQKLMFDIVHWYNTYNNTNSNWGIKGVKFQTFAF